MKLDKKHCVLWFMNEQDSLAIPEIVMGPPGSRPITNVENKRSDGLITRKLDRRTVAT